MCKNGKAIKFWSVVENRPSSSKVSL